MPTLGALLARTRRHAKGNFVVVNFYPRVLDHYAPKKKKKKNSSLRARQ
jgi:hypothetical protein